MGGNSAYPTLAYVRGPIPARKLGVEKMNVYLDYQSGKPVDPGVVEAVAQFHRLQYGNPSALHQVGDDAMHILEDARQTIAGFIGAQENEIIFTSGATESNNLGIIGYAMRNRRKGNHIIISETEHISIHNIAKYLEKNGFAVSKVPVDQYGRVNPKKLAARFTGKTILVSVGYANNEIGTIQQVAEIGRLCRERNIAFHSDAVAAEGLVPIDINRDNIDMLTLSSNDIYGPTGVGVLYLRKGFSITPMLIGGGQEFGLRSGTENLAGIVGMKRAVEIMEEKMSDETARFEEYSDRLIASIPEKIPHCYLNGHPVQRLPNNVHFRFDGIEGESLLLSLKDKGISVSTGSACSSKTLEPSHTLISLGLLHEEAHGSMELTCGRFNTLEDVENLIDVLPEVVEKLRELSPLYND